MRDIISVKRDQLYKNNTRISSGSCKPRIIGIEYEECWNPNDLGLTVFVNYALMQIELTDNGSGTAPVEYSLNAIDWQLSPIFPMPVVGNHIAYIRDAALVTDYAPFTVREAAFYGIAYYGISPYGF